MKSTIAMFGLAAALLLGLFAPTLAASAQDAPAVAPVPVSGSDENGRSFEGTFTLTQFVARGQELLAEGTLAGEFTNPGGHTKDVSRTVYLPVTAVTDEASAGAVRAQASCEVLFLQIGPIELRLLGLHLNIDTITIDLTAVPTEGLLGQLLCSLAGGLPLSQLQQLANLLNQILALLG
jgi:hypothetical protein